MDLDIIFSYLFLGALFLLPLLIPLGIYLIIARNGRKTWLWSGIAAIAVSLVSSPIWFMAIVFTFAGFS